MTHGHVFLDAPPGGELNPNAGEDLGTRLDKKLSPVPFEGRGSRVEGSKGGGDGLTGTVMHRGQKKQPRCREQALEYRRAGGNWRRNELRSTWWCQSEQVRDGRTDEPGSIQAQLG